MMSLFLNERVFCMFLYVDLLVCVCVGFKYENEIVLLQKLQFTKMFI